MIKTWLLLLVCMVGAVFSHGQSPLVRHRFLNESGSAVKVNCLALDTNGMMWLGAENGLYTFDGHDILLASDSVREQVTAITCTQQGIIYGSAKGEVNSLHEGRITRLLKANATISCIVADEQALLIGTLGDGVFCLRPSQPTVHLSTQDQLPDDYVYDIIVHAGSRYIATDLGVFVADINDKIGAWRRFISNSDIARTMTHWSPDGKHLGVLLAGFQEAWITRYSDYPDLPEMNWKLTGQVNSMLHLANRLTWIAASDGTLYEMKDYRTVSPLINIGRHINKMIGDKAGNVWLATNEGLSQVTQRGLQYIRAQDGLRLSKIAALVANTEGVFFSQDASLMLLDKIGRQSKILSAPDLITCLYNDDHGGLWIGTSGKGVVYRSRNGKIKSFPQYAELSDNHILSLAGKGNKLWLSALNGIEEIDISSEGDVTNIRHHSKREGIGSDYVYHLFVDSKSRVWMGTDGAGVAVYDHGKIYQWNKELGAKNTVVYSISQDTYGNIWAGTLDHGVFRYDGKAWAHFGKEEGLQDETIFSLAALDGGQMMMVSAKGFDLWFPRDQLFKHFNRRNGLGIDSTSDVLNAVANDGLGNVWAPVHDGFLLINNRDSSVSIKPGISITNISPKAAAGPNHNNEYKYDDNYFTFRFSGVNYAHGERLFYRYRLVGFNDSWTITTDESTSYPKLPPGNYTFEVQASLNRGFYHPATDRFAFTINAPFWRQYWFIGSSLLVISALIYFTIQLRVKAIRKTAQLKQERLAFEYEYLKSQVNPHFLFNSLNTLITLIEEDPVSAVNYTEQLSDLYRDALSRHDNDLISLGDEWKVLERYLYIQKNRFGEALQMVANVTEQQKTKLKIVPLALQLLMENAVKHNVVSAAHPLIVSIDIIEDRMVIKNAIRKKITPEKSSGLGLQHIVKRYALVTDKPVEIQESEQEFMVTLPLL